MIPAGDFFSHLQGLISRTPDCNGTVLESVLDCIEASRHAFSGMSSYASCWKIQQYLFRQLQVMHTAFDIRTEFLDRKFHFDFFSACSPCNSFNFGFVTIEIYMNLYGNLR